MMKSKLWLITGIEELNRNEFHEVKNGNINKANGGLWCSPLELSDDGYYSDWQRWCYENSLSNWVTNKGVILSLKKDARIYTIDSQKDLIELFKIVGEFNIFGTVSNCFKCLDFENAKKHYDAIYLTKKGQFQTHIPRQNYAYNLYGWDCSCLYIMNYDIINKTMRVKLSNRPTFE